MRVSSNLLVVRRKSFKTNELVDVTKLELRKRRVSIKENFVISNNLLTISLIFLSPKATLWATIK